MEVYVMKHLRMYSFVLALAALPAFAQKGTSDRNTIPPAQDHMSREVRHELVMLPYYGVFDNLAYRVDGSKVTLFGQVTRPTLKSDAEHVVKKIEVLPLSPNDDQIRRAAYRQIYSKPTLQRYQMGAVPPIHIIVKNGNITLVGIVDNEGDKDLAGMAANGVPGAFKVTNELVVGK